MKKVRLVPEKTVSVERKDSATEKKELKRLLSKVKEPVRIVPEGNSLKVVFGGTDNEDIVAFAKIFSVQKSDKPTAEQFVAGVLALKDDPEWGMYAREAFKQINETELLVRLKVLEEKVEPPSNKKYSLIEAATYLNVSERHLRYLIKEKRIPSFKAGKKIQFHQSDLDIYISKIKKKPAERTVPTLKKHKIDHAAAFEIAMWKTGGKRNASKKD